ARSPRRPAGTATPTSRPPSRPVRTSSAPARPRPTRRRGGRSPAPAATAPSATGSDEPLPHPPLPWLSPSPPPSATTAPTRARGAARTDTTGGRAVWGQNFPRQYDLYRRTVDMTRTRYGGSEALPRRPTGEDPRDTVSVSRLDEDPRLREFWAGYAFAEDFREERGHAYMLSDQVFTRRQVVAQQPGTCLNCHASTYVAYLRAGNGDLMEGFARVNQMPYQEAVRLVDHPVACIDCHDPETMRLRVTRPAFMEGIRALKAGQGVEDYDVNRDATRQEMRTYVCGQCHVEYYFAGTEKRLTYPWDRGLTADSILAYYEANGHNDWTHQVSGGG